MVKLCDLNGLSLVVQVILCLYRCVNVADFSVTGDLISRLHCVSIELLALRQNDAV